MSNIEEIKKALGITTRPNLNKKPTIAFGNDNSKLYKCWGEPYPIKAETVKRLGIEHKVYETIDRGEYAKLLKEVQLEEQRKKEAEEQRRIEERLSLPF